MLPPHFSPMYTVHEIIKYLNQHDMAVAVVGSRSVGEKNPTVADTTPVTLGDKPITGTGTLSDATTQQLAFLANPRYADQLASTQASAVLVTADNAHLCPAHSVALVVKNPYLAYAIVSELFAYHSSAISHANSPSLSTNIHPSAIIHPTAIIYPTARLGENVKIGAYCVIGEGVVVSGNSQLDSHVTLEDFVKIGQFCHLQSHSFIGHHCELGDFVTLHSHASIGNEGFGFAPKGATDTAGWQKIHQLGRVIIGNQVRVGSHTCIDRGAIGDTVIGDNVIIDNLVQIAHNVQIGAGTAVAGCVGIAGSSEVGKRCVLAGGVGLVGHIEICDDVTITGMTMVTKSITQAGSYSSGTPMLPTALWRKVAVKFKQLI